MRAATDNVRLAPGCNNILMGPEKVAESSRADIGTFFQNLAPHIKDVIICLVAVSRSAPHRHKHCGAAMEQLFFAGGTFQTTGEVAVEVARRSRHATR